MTRPLIDTAALALILGLAFPATPMAQTDKQAVHLFTAPLAIDRKQVRPPVDSLPVPAGFTKEQIALGDRIFHGEAAGGRCSICHGVDAKGTQFGNDLTTGRFIWSDGSVHMIKHTIMHNMSVAPGMDGDLSPADVAAVSAYVWALGRQNR